MPNVLSIECSSIISVIPINQQRAPTKIKVQLSEYNLNQIMIELLEDYSEDSIFEALKAASR